jgi:ribosome-binding protein aMBF1 (putative translation factor)
MLLYTYICGSDRGTLDAAQRSMEAYARAQGHPAGIQSATNLAESIPGGPVLQETLSRIGRGDTLVVQSLSAFGTLPSEIEATLMKAVASGAAVHLIDLGRIENSLLAVRATLEVSRHLEQEYKNTRALINKLNEQHQQDLEDHGAEIISRMSSTFGVRNLLKTLDKSAEVNPVGVFIRQQREALSLSQADLAAKVNVSKSTIQRAEQHGVADNIGAILAALSAPATYEQGHAAA